MPRQRHKNALNVRTHNFFALYYSVRSRAWFDGSVYFECLGLCPAFNVFYPLVSCYWICCFSFLFVCWKMNEEKKWKKKINRLMKSVEKKMAMRECLTVIRHLFDAYGVDVSYINKHMQFPCIDARRAPSGSFENFDFNWVSWSEEFKWTKNGSNSDSDSDSSGTTIAIMLWWYWLCFVYLAVKQCESV